MKLALSIAVMALLAGCATAPSKPPCIHPVPYSPEIQRQAADELEALEGEGRAPAIRRMIEDYGDLRARVRASCQP